MKNIAFIEFLEFFWTKYILFYQTCIDDSSGVLCEPLQYEEVAAICSKLKPGISGIMIDYEHIRFAGPALWDTLFQLYDNYFETS